ncbi:MAG: methyltransferase domain-containing protein [Candidatus Aenigmarchaeota archaeon]|nr:methyltransferase domain-containing protein [Candidatus Aenigmarchaeota archaeon]
MNESVRKLFDAKKDYDDRRDKYYFERRVRELKKILENTSKEANILDVGCGTGINVEFLHQHGFSNVCGSDISRTLLETARAKNLRNMVLTGSIELPFKDASFDLVTMLDVIEHMDGYKNNLSEISRILKPGGRLFITYPNPGMIWLIDIMAAIGLKIPGKENKVPFPELEEAAQPFFECETFQPIVLVSKLPRFALHFFEMVEKIMPGRLLRRVALSYVVVLKRTFN